jgi:hypothetical protein
MRWPRCRWLYVTSADDVRAGRWWECQKPWLHWLLPRRWGGMPHEGPRTDKRPRVAKGYP